MPKTYLKQFTLCLCSIVSGVVFWIIFLLWVCYILCYTLVNILV